MSKLLKHTKFALLYLLTMNMLPSCIQISGVGSGRRFFAKDEKADESFSFVINEGVPEVGNKDELYLINDKDILELLRKKDSSIIYIWTPNCHSSACIPLSSFEYSCESNGYFPVIVAETYDYEIFKAQHHSSNLYVLNYDYYKTNNAAKCLRTFRQSIEGDKYNKKDYYRYLVFAGDSFLYSKQYMD